MGLTPSRLSQRVARTSARIGRWPRRLAALACLLLAAGSALTPAATDTVHHSTGIAERLRAGEVALPVPVSPAGAVLVHPGQRVGLVTPHGLVADGLRVLTVHAADQSLSADADAVVVVAASRSQAVTVARASADRLVLIVDRLP